MNAFMKRFLTRAIILTLSYFLVGLVIYEWVIPYRYEEVFPVLLIFFFLTTSIIHHYMLKISDISVPKFTARFMAMISLKMFFYLIIAIIYVLIRTEHAKFFLINFFVVYIGYTALEVSEIVRIVKMKK
ncbi:MAG TPA: hypothetical protein VKA27_18840 [Sunxiuqinia sp.]|nr:hypothetical protein [Sunxiuqinia sp.]